MSVTSSSTTGAGSGSRLAMVWVIRKVRPKEVSTTCAPCSCASRATWKAMEVSMRTPVMRIFLPSRSMGGTLVRGRPPTSEVNLVGRTRRQCPIPSPPSTGITAPLMYAASGPARKRTTCATSSGVANRPVGICDR